MNYYNLVKYLITYLQWIAELKNRNLKENSNNKTQFGNYYKILTSLNFNCKQLFLNYFMDLVTSEYQHFNLDNIFKICIHKLLLLLT